MMNPHNYSMGLTVQTCIVGVICYDTAWGILCSVHFV